MTRKNLLDARTVSYLELIGNGKSYSVPPYQRDYSWTEEEWSDLWNDIVGLREAPAERHFMGPLVVEARSDLDFVVIDGQQRLATLGLLALAVIARLLALAEEGTEPEANRIWAQRLRDRFVGEKHPTSHFESSRLSLNEANDGFWQSYLVRLRKPRNPQSLPRSNRLLHDGFLYFGERLDELGELQSGGEAMASLMFEAVARKLLFVLIIAGDDLDAYTVFETLNARGVGLTTTDLLKNYLFAQLRDPTDRAELDRQWRGLVGTVSPERFPEFLRTHLLTEQPEVRHPRRLFRTVRENFYALPEVIGLIERLDERSELFAALSDPGHELWTERPEARPFLRELVLFRVPQTAPLLLAAWERFPPPDFDRVLKLISVISFRYRVVSGRNGGGLEQVCARAARRITDGTARSPAAVSRLLEPLQVEDTKMRQDFARLRVNTRGPRKKLARYILARLESDASGSHIDPETDPGTLEHILPENPGEEWEAAFPPDRQEAYTYRIGNLALLAAGANREIGRRPYSEKLTAYRRSTYALTREIAELAPEEWTPALLEYRQQRLADRAVHIWRSDFA